MAIFILNTLYSESDLFKVWNGYWSKTKKTGFPYEYVLRKNNERILTPLSTINPLFWIAFDNEKPVGYCGLEDNGSFFATAGVVVIPEYQGKKISSELMKKRLAKVGSKPILAGINNKNLPAGTWKNSWKRRGYRDIDLNNLPKGIPYNVAKEQVDAKGQENVLVYSKDNILKAKDAAVNKPMPQITRRKKVIRSGDKGRTIQGKNFPEWKEILRKPQNKTLLKQKRKNYGRKDRRSRGTLNNEDIELIDYIMGDKQPRTVERIYDDIYDDIQEQRKASRKDRREGYKTRFGATRYMLQQYLANSGKYNVKDLGKDEYGRKKNEYTQI